MNAHYTTGIQCITFDAWQGGYIASGQYGYNLNYWAMETYSDAWDKVLAYIARHPAADEQHGAPALMGE